MEESYYRDLIERLEEQEKAMFRTEREPSFEDFEKLWGILTDEEAVKFPNTFFRGAEMCMSSFYGSTQDSNYVWEGIVDHYHKAAMDENAKDDFRKAFMDYLPSTFQYPNKLSVIIDILDIAMAIGDYDFVVTAAYCATDYWCDNECEDADNYPVAAAYIECLTNSAGQTPESCHSNPKFIDTVKALYEKFGDDPNHTQLIAAYRRFVV